MTIPPFSPLRRKARLEVRDVGDGLLVYEVDTEVVHHLQGLAGRVWGEARAARSWSELAQRCGCTEAEAVAVSEELAAAGLLETSGVSPLSRRAVLARGAFVGGAAVVGGPLVTSLLSPAAAGAVSEIVATVDGVLTSPPAVPVNPATLTTVYDPYVDFNADRTHNPTQTWTWAYKAAIAGNSISTYPSVFTGGTAGPRSGYTYWARAAQSNLYAPSDSWVGINPTLVPGKLLMHPAPSSVCAEATFRVPTAGAYEGRMTFTYENPSGSTAIFSSLGTPVTGAAPGEDGVQVAVYRGDNSTWILPVTMLNATTTSVSIDISGANTPGLNFHFVVGATSSGKNVNDLVSLRGQITVSN